MKKLALSLLVFCAAFLTAHAQHSTKSVDVTQTPPEVIFKKVINTPKLKNQQITMIIVTFAPGEVSGAHRHPIQTVAYVLEGELQSTFNGKVERFKKGDAFYEDPNGLHAETRNLSATKEAKLLVYFIGDKGKTFITAAH
ncbi:cupin domain-containing protein [Mucilaginibacter gynuensis]|uniref:Cupin domain-containing protein n=1 Tax=Mucilaginibacter gynuensis TaxID=1302236 RepID=A0ABP8GFV0_9SPHI